MDKNNNQKLEIIMVHEFIMGAYPYIVIGLAIAAVASVYASKAKRDKKAKAEGKESSESMRLGDWIRANGCFVAAMSMYAAGFMMWINNSDSSTPVTWLCLGSAFLCFGAADLNKKNDNASNDDNERV